MARPRIRTRLFVLSSALVIIAAMLIWRAAYLSLGDDNRTRTNLVLMTRTPLSLSKLEAQTKLINKVSLHIEDYSLKDITRLLSDTARLASNANREIRAQTDAWVEIKASASKDAKTFKDLQQSLATTNQLQAQEIDRLRDVLDSAEKSTPFYSAMSFIATFAGGIIMTILADYLRKRFSPKLGRAFIRFKKRCQGQFLTGDWRSG